MEAQRGQTYEFCQQGRWGETVEFAFFFFFFFVKTNQTFQSKAQSEQEILGSHHVWLSVHRRSSYVILKTVGQCGPITRTDYCFTSSTPRVKATLGSSSVTKPTVTLALSNNIHSAFGQKKNPKTTFIADKSLEFKILQRPSSDLAWFCPLQPNAGTWWGREPLTVMETVPAHCFSNAVSRPTSPMGRFWFWSLPV